MTISRKWRGIAAVAGVLTLVAVVAPSPAPAYADDGTVTFVGHGYGHGRGMSQYGAYGWAVNSGSPYDQILAFYYGGTTLRADAGNPVVHVELTRVTGGDTIVTGTGLTMLAGISLVALSLEVMLPVTAHADPVTREDIALALSVVLLGLLMMVTRRNAVSQVAAFLSLENGVDLAAAAAQGMPLVVEISIAFSVLIAFLVIGVFLFRIRERFDTVDIRALDEFRGDRQ